MNSHCQSVAIQTETDRSTFTPEMTPFLPAECPLLFLGRGLEGPIDGMDPQAPTVVVNPSRLSPLRYSSQKEAPNVNVPMVVSNTELIGVAIKFQRKTRDLMPKERGLRAEKNRSSFK
ncbi:hypothetical protein AVEN_52520-1 [Araneus ventricosus]|uniref:Uncharacterized protein n=1 Tax=Araneus ventricosus TaxID=182803 RepID=A0A4Y2M7B6_ARAVE|nr:hypothetical protein AVEN_52520-1 [Araneus ventricosus]